MGQILLEQRRNLPDSSDFKAAESRRQQLLIESGLRQIGNQQERSRLRDINEYVDELIAPFSEAWRNLLLQEEILGLAEIRRDLLDKAIVADDTYLKRWVSWILPRANCRNRYLPITSSSTSDCSGFAPESHLPGKRLARSQTVSTCLFPPSTGWKSVRRWCSPILPLGIAHRHRVFHVVKGKNDGPACFASAQWAQRWPTLTRSLSL
jgi:hypothetical protein